MPHPLRVGVVGAGRAGRALATALYRAGWPVVATTAHDHAARVAVTTAVPSARVLAAAEVARRAELLLLTVPDDAIAVTAERLAPHVTPGTVVVHASGRHGLAVLADLVQARPVALHPAMTLPGRLEDVDRLRGAAFGVTARDEDWPLAAELAVTLGGFPVRVPDALRPLWHAALAHGANHLVTLVADAVDLLRAAGAADPAAVLAPLLEAALQGALREGDAVLTGPVARGDAATVAAHVAAVRRHAPAQLPAYSALARRTTQRAVVAGRLAPAPAARVLDALRPDPVPAPVPA